MKNAGLEDSEHAPDDGFRPFLSFFSVLLFDQSLSSPVFFNVAD